MQEIYQSLKLTLLNIGYVKLGKDWHYDNVISPFARLYYSKKGHAKVTLEEQVLQLRPNKLYLIPSYTFGSYHCDNYHEQYYISFLEEIKSGQSIYNLKEFIYETEATAQDEYYFERLLQLNPNRALLNKDPKVYDNQTTLQGFAKRNEELSAQHYIETNGMLAILLSRFITARNKNPYDSNSIKKELIHILNYIDENLHKPLSIADLATYCSLSQDHFSRIFKKTLGLGPVRYLQTKRIERAQILLLTTNYSLAEISEKIGMGTPSYFSKVFRDCTGTTPGSFRKGGLRI